jgi:hypothetical protein
MEKSLRLTKSLGEIDTESGVFELFATADATYDRQTRTAVVMLNSYLFLRQPKCPTARLFADSNVGPRTMAQEATEATYVEVVAKIFANWVNSVEQAEPRPFASSASVTSTVRRTISSVSSIPASPVSLLHQSQPASPVRQTG